MSLLELFCHVDDFCQAFLPYWQREQLSRGRRQRRRARGLRLSEVMTLLNRFHQSDYRDFKAFYTEHVRQLCWLHHSFKAILRRIHSSRHTAIGMMQAA